MTGRAENQAAFWSYPDETRFALQRYLSAKKDEHIYNISIGKTSNDGETSASAIYTGETNTHIVYPEGVSAVANIAESNTYEIQQAARAAEIMETGYTDDATQAFVGTPPSIGGEIVRGVMFLHPYCRYDLRWDDSNQYDNWLRDARERSEENPIWKGIPDKFMVDGILHVVMREPLASKMLHTTTVLGGTPQTQVAVNVYMTANAVLRSTAIEDILEFEWWDGRQFQRTIGGTYTGLTKTRFNRSDSSNAQDWGAVAVPCAARSHNN
jgi:hypothetical protein